MKLRDLLPIKEPIGQTKIRGITDDSRRAGEGDAFFCLDGPAADGHRFAKEAVENGAAVVVAQRDLGLPNQCVVPDTHAAFAQACAVWFGHPERALTLIGVTGTNGKTSVTYMLKAILEQAGRKTGLIGTIQNMIGDEALPAKNTTPGTFEIYALLAKMRDAGCAAVCMEVSSHALAQRRVEGLPFEAALFTNLTQDHLDYHKTMERYLAAKQKLFGMSKRAVVNLDDSYMDAMLTHFTGPVITYSARQDSATYSAKDIQYRPDGVEFALVGFGLVVKIKLVTGGQFSVYNAMCAAACALSLGVSPQDVAAGLGALQGVKGRAEVVPTGRDFTVIIDYAHTPDGLQNILSSFRRFESSRLVVLFGCGGDRDKTKRPLMGQIAARLADSVIVTSDNPRTEDPQAIIDDILQGMRDTKTPYVVMPNRVDAIHYAVKNARAGDIIVLAGKGHETYQVLKDGTIHLDEREIVAAALAEMTQR